MKPDSAMIFAAGLGTRMGALTRTCPKPLLRVAGRPLLEHALELVRGAEIGNIVVNTHAHADQMHDHLARYAPDVLVSHEPDLLETGGGLRNATPLFTGGAVHTLNADMVWRGKNPLAMLGTNWDNTGMDALLCLMPRENAAGHTGPGDFFLNDDCRPVRRGNSAKADFVYTGAQIIKLNTLQHYSAGAFSLNPVWDELLDKGTLRGIVYDGSWVDVGRPEGIETATSVLLP